MERLLITQSVIKHPSWKTINSSHRMLTQPLLTYRLWTLLKAKYSNTCRQTTWIKKGLGHLFPIMSSKLTSSLQIKPTVISSKEMRTSNCRETYSTRGRCRISQAKLKTLRRYSIDQDHFSVLTKLNPLLLEKVQRRHLIRMSISITTHSKMEKTKSATIQSRSRGSVRRNKLD